MSQLQFNNVQLKLGVKMEKALGYISAIQEAISQVIPVAQKDMAKTNCKQYLFGGKETNQHTMTTLQRKSGYLTLLPSIRQL